MLEPEIAALDDGAVDHLGESRADARPPRTARLAQMIPRQSERLHAFDGVLGALAPVPLLVRCRSRRLQALRDARHLDRRPFALSAGRRNALGVEADRDGPQARSTSACSIPR
jgi:hypothetical protein